jgi:hypothetical protein
MEPAFNTMLSAVRAAAGKRILFLPHAVRQMARPDRMITTTDIRSVIFDGEIIEDYPEDARGHSCLMLGFDEETRAIHLVCSPRDEYLAIITAYLPDEDEWSEDFRQRL